MPTPEQVVFDSNAGKADPGMPGLQSVLTAWNTVNDFVGSWQNDQSQFAQGISDMVAPIAGGIGYAIPTG